MQRKYLSRENWARIIKREDKNIYVKEKDSTGNIHLLKMIEVAKPLVNMKFDSNEFIIDNNYSWLMLLPDNKPYVITGQFDNKNKLLQVYIDIINDSGIENGKIYYDDIYIDVILHYDGKVSLDDVDELQSALQEGIISKEQYERAYKNGLDVYEDMKLNPDKWFNIVRKYFDKIKEEI